ncbi:MAG: type I pantothenate kinase [Myxococcales bacterium FL481]|nr:MAG: type I pantothenate kinase [Myxococcales bacterium FL481]
MTGAPPKSQTTSPYVVFNRDQWAALRADTPLAMGEGELARLRSVGEQIQLDEVREIYLPLSRLLSLHVAGASALHRETSRFLRRGRKRGQVPYVIGLGGSVAVGKSTTARILAELLAREPDHPKVELLTTDGFLWPNAELEARGLMQRKGFPESYNLPHLLQVMEQVKSGNPAVAAPVYSHLAYDVVADGWQTIEQPDILIVEGLNVLQAGPYPEGGAERVFVSDYFDFSIYVDAPEALIEQWYVDRFLDFRDRVFGDERSYFHRYATLDDERARGTARQIWASINAVNLHENILPTRGRAKLVLRKGERHRVEQVRLRRL